MKKFTILFAFAFIVFACGTKKNLYQNSFNQDMFECTGTEPFWNISMEPDVIVFHALGADKVYFPYRDAIEKDGQLIFKTFLQEGNKSTRLQLTLTKEQCSDNMSDETYPFTAIVEMDGKVYNGCAK